MVLKTADSITYNPIVEALPKQMLPPNHVVSVQTQIVCCRFPAFEQARDYVRALGVTTRIQRAALVQAHGLPATMSPPNHIMTHPTALKIMVVLVGMIGSG